jgi:hypothetical protein
MNKTPVNYQPLTQLKGDAFKNLGLSAVVIMLGFIVVTIVGFFFNINLQPLGMIGFVVVLAVVFNESNKIAKNNRAVLGAFATANNWLYEQAGLVSSTIGTVFTIGHSKRFQNKISGNIQDLPFSMYEYHYTTGGGKNSRYFDLQVFEISLPRNLPHMVIDSLVENGNGNSSTLPIDFDKDQKIDLEGDFSKYFALYAPDSYGVTALTVLAPDVMEVIMKHASNCDIEIIQNKLFIYWPDIARNQTDFEDKFTSVEEILAKSKTKLTKSDVYSTDKQSVVHATASTQAVRLKVGWWNNTTKIAVVTLFTSLFLLNGFMFESKLATITSGLFFIIFIIGGFVFVTLKISQTFKRRRLNEELKNRKF